MYIYIYVDAYICVCIYIYIYICIYIHIYIYICIFIENIYMGDGGGAAVSTDSKILKSEPATQMTLSIDCESNF